jgi:hypothetical protein
MHDDLHSVFYGILVHKATSHCHSILPAALRRYPAATRLFQAAAAM